MRSPHRTLSLLTLLAALLPPPAAAQAPPEPDRRDAFPADPARWLVTDAPRPRSPRWELADSDATNIWAVDAPDGAPRVRRYPPPHRPDPPLPPAVARAADATLRAVSSRGGTARGLRVDGGWLVALDGGEWGGGLWWYDPEGRGGYEVLRWPIAFLLPGPGGPVACGGAMNAWRVYRLRRDGAGRWRGRQVSDRPAREGATAVGPDGSVVLVHGGDVVRIDPEGREEVLPGEVFRGRDREVSCAVDGSGSIYVGMRHYVLRVRRAGGGYRAEYLLPNRVAVEDEKLNSNVEGDDQPTTRQG